MSTAWAVLTWSPFRQRLRTQRWWFTAFRLLYVIPTILILFGWCDDTVHFDVQSIEGDEGVGVVEKEPDWNSPLYLGDGRCLVIDTREQVEC